MFRVCLEVFNGHIQSFIIISTSAPSLSALNPAPCQGFRSSSTSSRRPRGLEALARPTSRRLSSSCCECAAPGFGFRWCAPQAFAGREKDGDWVTGLTGQTQMLLCAGGRETNLLAENTVTQIIVGHFVGQVWASGCNWQNVLWALESQAFMWTVGWLIACCN